VAEGVRGLVVFITRGFAMVLVVVGCGDLAAAWAEPLEAAMMGAWECGEEGCVCVCVGAVCCCVDVWGLMPSGLGRRGLRLAAGSVERCGLGCCDLLVGEGAATEEPWVRGEVAVVVVAVAAGTVVGWAWYACRWG
jgi:hypothetical protein